MTFTKKAQIMAKTYGAWGNLGLLILRIGIGLMFILHGYPKLLGGTEMWEQIGGAMSNFGIGFYHMVWGFLAAFAEVVGGLLLILGFLFRPAAIMLFFTMVVATVMHLNNGDPFEIYSHAIESGILFLALTFIGPGAYSIGGGSSKKAVMLKE